MQSLLPHPTFVLTSEAAEALAVYLEARRRRQGGGAGTVVHVNAGSGYLAYHLNATRALSVPILACDARPLPTPSLPPNTFPVQPLDVRAAEVVLAVDAIWLLELVEPFVATTAALLLHGADPPTFVLAFRERANDGATGAFAAGAAVMAEFAARGCDVREHGPIGTAHRATLYEITLKSRGGEH